MSQRWMCTDCLTEGEGVVPDGCPGCGAAAAWFATCAKADEGSVKEKWDQVWDHFMDMVDEADDSDGRTKH